MAPLDSAANDKKGDKDLLPRGMVANTPALFHRADEAFLDFVSDARNALMHAQGRAINDRADEILTEAEKKTGRRPNSADAVRDIARSDIYLGTYLRVKRTLQEAYWQRIAESYGEKAEALEEALAKSDKSGPGSVKWDPNFITPEYATVDIHVQPGGYTGNPLVAWTYDYGTKVFFGGANDGDVLHHKTANKTAIPQDGRVARILEVGCSIGQFACGLKLRFPDAEVWGIDIGAPMVRYAHWRTIQQGLDVHYAQMPAEDMDFPDNHFDLVVSHIMFHEVPVPAIKRVLKEVKRVLRPGGTFVVWDFQTAHDNKSGYGGFLGLMDGADNGEPYAVGFVNCNIEQLLQDAGYKLRSLDPEAIAKDGRVADKV